MSVTFCGHGDIRYNDTLQSELKTEIEKVIHQGETNFFLGGYGSFDDLAAHTLKTLKMQYPQILATLVLPYINREYDPRLYEDSLYPPLETVPKKFAIIRRNEWMVDHADILIAYVKYDWGGAAKTLRYAVRKQKTIVNLATRECL